MNMTIKIIHVGLIALCLGIVNSASPCDTNIYLEVGKQGTVHCRFQDFQILGWINGDGHHGETIPFIYLENSVKKGRGYDSGDYDILPDGSLIINNVQLKHEFNFSVSYTPIVGRTMLAFVPVSVYVRPSPEYPVVNRLTNQQYIYQEVEFYSGPINCTMDGVRPGVDLEWVYQSDVISMENEPSSIVSSTDGTFNTSLSSRYTIRDRSVSKITLQCRIAGAMQDLFPSVTIINLLNLKRCFPVVNELARQQHLVLHLKRQDELNCSMRRVSKGVSVEWVILNSELSSEITFKDEFTKDDNGDGTSNVTLKSSFNVMSSSIQYVTFQCRVSGRRANLYPDVTTVDILFSESTSSDNISRWSFTLETLILSIAIPVLVAIVILLILIFLKISKKDTVYFPENQPAAAVPPNRRGYEEIATNPGDHSDQQSQEGTPPGTISGEEELRKRLLDKKIDNVASGSSSYGIHTATTEM